VRASLSVVRFWPLSLVACADLASPPSAVFDPTSPAAPSVIGASADGGGVGTDAAVVAPVTVGTGNNSPLAGPPALADAGAGNPDAHVDSSTPSVPPSNAVDAAAGDAAILPPAQVDLVFGGPTVCSSGRYWRGGNEGSEWMSPGQACVACHRREGDEAPIYAIAGTVYTTGHEPDDCNGTGSTDIKVRVIDARGRTALLSTNSAGNFMTTQAFAFPAQVAVVRGSEVRPMDGAINAADGDCNRCHSEAGSDGAPGRIALP
jgi:hypothetical protein